MEMNKKAMVHVLIPIIVILVLAIILVAIALPMWAKTRPPSPNDKFTVTIVGTLGSSATLQGIAPDLTITGVEYEKEILGGAFVMDFDELLLWERTFDISLFINGVFVERCQITKNISGTEAWDFVVKHMPRGTYKIIVQARNVENGLTDTKSYTLIIPMVGE